MKAETGAIVAEVEYNRQNSNSSSDVEGEADSGSEDYNSNSDELYLNGNDINAKYSINNVDFGLVERPKAQLELNKKVTNVRLTLANGQIIVDSTTQGPYLSWVSEKHITYFKNVQNKMIQFMKLIIMKTMVEKDIKTMMRKPRYRVL